MHFAIGVILRPGGGADGVAGLGDQQWLATGDEVRKRQIACGWLGMRGRLCRLDRRGSTR
jgi:hypothetical protein